MVDYFCLKKGILIQVIYIFRIVYGFDYFALLLDILPKLFDIKISV